MRRPVNRQRIYESNFYGTKVRGTVHQIIAKYEALALEALKTGNDIESIKYTQHAEHWKRHGRG